MSYSIDTAEQIVRIIENKFNIRLDEETIEEIEETIDTLIDSMNADFDIQIKDGIPITDIDGLIE